jgi:hypothetical protein
MRSLDKEQESQNMNKFMVDKKIHHKALIINEF